MLHLLQAATMPQASVSTSTVLGGVWTIALLMLGWMQKRSSEERAELRDEVKLDASRITALEVHNAELRTHVGVDGNGLTTQFRDLIGEVRGLRNDLTEAMQELAEQRGAKRQQGG